MCFIRKCLCHQRQTGRDANGIRTYDIEYPDILDTEDRTYDPVMTGFIKMLGFPEEDSSGIEVTHDNQDTHV